MSLLEKKTVDEWLNSVDYDTLNSGHYVPSEFALEFMNFIKLVNGAEGEEHKTPVVHLKMLDQITGQKQYIANLCSRGIAKTTLFFEYLAPYIAIFEEIPGFGKIEGMIYVSDSMDNGVKSARKNLEFRYNNSPFLQTYLPKAHFTDNYIEFENKSGHKLGIKMFGAKALSLDSKLYRADGGTITIGEVQVGDRIMGADGKPTTVTRKSEVFNKPMYELVLADGRKLKVSEDHLNQVHVKKFQSERTFSKYTLEEKTLTTLELLEEPMFAVDPRGNKRPLLWVENAKPMEWPENKDILIDPYTVGLLIGDGSMNRKAAGNVPVVLTAHEDDWPLYEKEIPYSLGKPYRDKRNPATISRTVQGINQFVSMHGLDTHGSQKEVPEDYLYGSPEQRLALLQGLMDSDGTATKDGKSTFCSSSKKLVEQVMWLTRSLGGESRWMDKGNARAFQCTVRLDLPVFRLERKLVRQKPARNDKMAIVAINRIADEPSQCIAVDNEERQFVAEDFFRTHNTGLRGTKIFGKRPTLAVLDDLVSDDDSKSKTAMQAIKDTIYKGVQFALHPTKKKIIFNGTPFNKDDILYEAVESGGWYVNVWPICEKFPCSEEEFRGAWEDRFPYSEIKKQYELAEATGKISAFNQELMLRITSDEERLVLDHEIGEYDRKLVLDNRERFNFYITTDWAVSDSQSADFSVISVWAYSPNKDWFWVDGIVKRQTIEKTQDDLFRLVQEYNPVSVGVEVTGQQLGFISLFQREMVNRNVWFNFARGRGNQPGIRPVHNKLSRFNSIVPQFKTHKIHFPKTKGLDPTLAGYVTEFVNQIKFVTMTGIKSKNDDCLDTVSMLAEMNPWTPDANNGKMERSEEGDWIIEGHSDFAGDSPMSSYVV